VVEGELREMRKAGMKAKKILEIPEQGQNQMRGNPANAYTIYPNLFSVKILTHIDFQFD